MTSDKSPDGGDPQPGEMSEAEIDRTIADSFPASDPPSWTVGTDHRDEPAEEGAGQPASDPAPDARAPAGGPPTPERPPEGALAPRDGPRRGSSSCV